MIKHTIVPTKMFLMISNYKRNAIKKLRPTSGIAEVGELEFRPPGADA